MPAITYAAVTPSSLNPAPVVVIDQYSSLPPVLTDGMGVVDQCDTAGSAYTNGEGRKLTYSAAISAVVVGTAATDVFAITGSATKTIRVTRVCMSGFATSATATAITAVVRSTANSAGTATTLTNVPHDSANAAGTAVVKAYTANPTTGTTVANVRSQRANLGTTSAPAPQPLVWDFGLRNGQGLVLRGVGQVLAVNFGGVTPAGATVDLDIEWTEE